jgi:CRP-like cAMP-binding protein
MVAAPVASGSPDADHPGMTGPRLSPKRQSQPAGRAVVPIRARAGARPGAGAGARARKAPALPAAALLERLRTSRWFAGLSEPLQRAIVARGVVRDYAAGAFIIRAGDPSKGLFTVLDGRVRMLVHVGDGEESVLHVGEAGFWFGHWSAMSGQPSQGSVVAATAVRALVLSPAQFEAVCALDPRYYREINGYVLAMFDYLFRYVGEAQGLAREQWLALRLADLAAMRRDDEVTRGPVTLRIPQSELASMVGASRQTVSGTLARLEARGLIAVRYRAIVVLDEAGLRRAANSLRSVSPPRPRSP